MILNWLFHSLYHLKCQFGGLRHSTEKRCLTTCLNNAIRRLQWSFSCRKTEKPSPIINKGQLLPWWGLQLVPHKNFQFCRAFLEIMKKIFRFEKLPEVEFRQPIHRGAFVWTFLRFLSMDTLTISNTFKNCDTCHSSHKKKKNVTMIINNRNNNDDINISSGNSSSSRSGCSILLSSNAILIKLWNCCHTSLAALYTCEENNHDR